MELWKCKCGVMNDEARESCAYCDAPKDPELFDGVSVEDDTKILKPVKQDEEE